MKEAHSEKKKQRKAATKMFSSLEGWEKIRSEKLINSPNARKWLNVEVGREGVGGKSRREMMRWF